MIISGIQNKLNQAYLTPNKQRHTQSYKSDKIAFSGNFSKLEKQALEAVRAYSLKNNVETCRVLKSGKDITHFFDIIESENLCKPGMKIEKFSLFGMFSSLFKYKCALKNSTYIHSHTQELPLSAPDIHAAVKLKSKKMVSITPEGKYMSIELDRKSRKGAKKLLPQLFSETSQKYNEMKTDYGDRFIFEDKTHSQEYANFMLDTLNDFFEKVGLKNETNFY